MIAERSTLVCIVCPGCGPELHPGDRAFASRPTQRYAPVWPYRLRPPRQNRPPGEAPEQRKAVKVAKCRREAVERIITVAMDALLDVTEFR